jgi:micrococcal nuclease
MYDYRAQCTEVVDGDTIRAHIDLGFSVWRDEHRLRLDGINAPEMHSHDPAQRALAVRARDRVAQLLPPGGFCEVRTRKDAREKFGGYLAVVILADGTVLNDLLVREGLAVPYHGGARPAS